MADTCIVCLGDLRTTLDGDPPPDAADNVLTAEASDDAKRALRSDAKSLEADEETIAHLLPCKHDLHNSCLKPWVERANSCPICRAAFNMVELSHTVGGPVVDSYVVQDKTQEAEVDPTMIIEDELFAVETWEPCVVCSIADDTHEKMYCDGCDKAVHVFCAGYNESPDVWYCESCLVDLETNVALPGVASALRRQTRRRGGNTQRRGRRTNDAIWARVWQEVSRRLDLDLDFPFDEDTEQRTEEQRREFRRWEERLQIASTQGATARLRDIAAARLNPSPTAQPAPESQEEIRAWNAFDKARESQEAPAAIRRRKRRATASPASPRDAEPSEQPQLKRPRLRRPPVPVIENAAAESSSTAARNADERGTFLSSLLHDVETKPTSAASPAGTEQLNGAFSPRDSSPVRSPTSSGHATPRQLSVTPPPQRPQSPLLSSTIVPMKSPVAATFSPFSPDAKTQTSSPDLRHGQRGRRRNGEDEGSRGPSPARTLSYSSKEEIQRMVKIALKPRYREKQITKEQYTDINRDVSRKMYDMVGDASALADEAGREKWQLTAEAEVQKAVAALSSTSDDDDDDALARELEKELVS